MMRLWRVVLSVALLFQCAFALAQQVNPNVWVAINSPADGAVFTAPANVTVSASAGVYDDGVFVRLLEVRQGTNVLASVTGEGISYTFQNLPPGTYTYSVRAQSNLNRTASASRSFSVISSGEHPPTISPNPPSGQPFIGPANIALSATASDSDGHVVAVDYYANGQRIGRATSAPYAVTWTGVGPGSYALTGVATDNNGKATTSTALQVVVAQSVIRGSIDGVGIVRSGEDYRISGWACSSGRTASVDVHVYVGDRAPAGQYLTQATADQESDGGIAAACEVGQGRFRFSIPLTADMRQAHANAPIYIHGISPAGADNALLSNSGTFRIPPPLQLARRYVYDAHQRLCKTIEPETGATVVDYDGAGNVVWSASGLDLPDPVACNRAEALASGRVVQRTYDTRQRLKTLTFPDGRGNQAWTYTPDGLAAQIATTNSSGEAAVVNRYRYNARRLLVAEDLEQQGVISATLRYDYNANGHLSGQHWPQNLSISFAPNARGQATQVGPFATGVRYYANGAVREFSYGNGVLHQMTQNARQLPARSVDAGIIDLSTSYDASGNVASIVDGLQGSSHDRQMQYDGQNRLTAVHSAQFGGDGWFRFGYDALDNIRTWSRGGAGKRFFYDGNNRLQSVTDDTGATISGFSYDVQGNLKNKNGRTFDFDHGNRLRGTGSERYRYDGHGRRTSTIGAATSPRQFMYANSGTLSYARDQGKNEHTQYIHLAGSLLAIRTSTGGAPFQTRYQHTDALGSPVAETSSTGQLIERTVYEPYGEVVNRPLRDGPGYTGHVTDASTGLSYMQQRYMDPELGMFLSVDPVTAYQQPMGQFNRYRYANNNPYKFVDPDGNKGKVAWLVELGTNQMRKLARLTQEQAVQARRAEQNVIADRRQVASQIETAAHGRDGQLKHAGHELNDGGKGLPHYQTDGVKGHSFWGKLSVGILAVATGLDQVAEAADMFDPSVSLTSGSGELVNHERTWFGAYKQIDPNGPDFYEADRMRVDGFQGVFRVEGRIDSKRLDNESKGK